MVAKSFLCLLDIAIYKSFVSYSKLKQDNRKLSFLQYRIQLSRELLMDSSPNISIPQSSSTVTSPSARLVERHFPDQVPSRQNGKPGQRNCVVCSSKAGRPRKTSTYYCKICGVDLCVVPCFELYHTKVNPSRYI